MSESQKNSFISFIDTMREKLDPKFETILNELEVDILISYLESQTV